jgi:hypothetical protein
MVHTTDGLGERWVGPKVIDVSKRDAPTSGAGARGFVALAEVVHTAHIIKEGLVELLLGLLLFA